MDSLDILKMMFNLSKQSDQNHVHFAKRSQRPSDANAQSDFDEVSN